MRWLYSLVWIIMIAVGAGCSSTRTYSDQVQGVNFSNYKTYAWLPNNRDTSGSVYNNEITYENLRRAVDQEMTSRGYVLDTKNPDVLVIVHTMFEERTDLVQSPLYSSYSYYYPGFYTGPWYPYYYTGYYNVPYVVGYDIREIQYTEGTVVVDVIDRSKNQLVWRGWSEEDLADPEDAADLYENVDKIFEKRYPLKAKK